MQLKPEQEASLLKRVQTILPSAKWAPEESWFEEGQSSKKPGKAVHFTPICSCEDRREGAELILFLRAALVGQHFNTVARVQHEVERWVEEGNLVWAGCGICQGRLTIDIRLFNIENRGRKSSKGLVSTGDQSFER